ncbi:MAG: YggT family protein [Comamonas sp.]|nr:YggT family protein [Comamonas sp.]
MGMEIVRFLLEVVCGIVAGASLLRWYMQWQRINFQNPVGQLVFALTDWLVLPLRRVLRPGGRTDSSSLLAALLVELVHYLVLWLMTGASSSVLLVLGLAFFGLLRLVITGCIGILLVYAILSWVQPHAPIASILARLSEPVLRPLRRVIPLVGGIDLSPLVALIGLQVLQMVLGQVQLQALMALSALAL